MKKKLHSRHHHLQHRKASLTRANKDYLVIVRGWMFIILFAIMLGIGAIVGNFLNQQLNQTPPQVAGAQIAR